MTKLLRLLADGRWIGPHGIGRFASNVLSRLPPHLELRSGPRLLSPLDPLWLSCKIGSHRPDLFFSPGFSVPAVNLSPFVFTIHDLICVQLPGASRASTCARKLYFQTVVRRAARQAYRVLTVSEHSRTELLKWTDLHDDAIVNVGNGIDPVFTPIGPRYDPGFNYILYVGNFKPHKNVNRLLEAFAQLDYPDLRLFLTGHGTPQLLATLRALALEQRVHFTGCVDDHRLAELYRGALLLVQPSLMEGFGLPPIEAMACGTPVVVSRLTSLPEVVRMLADSALLLLTACKSDPSCGLKQNAFTLARAQQELGANDIGHRKPGYGRLDDQQRVACLLIASVLGQEQIQSWNLTDTGQTVAGD